MLSEDLCFSSATSLAALIRARKTTPVEVVHAFLDRIESFNPRINAYCTIAGEHALVEAAKAEQAIAKGAPAPPLLGVPIAIKDLTPTAGIRTTFGSKIFADYIPKQDSVFVQRIKHAGAIVLGKTNTAEFGYTGTTDNPLFGRTNNPWDLGRAVGGSSGGSAAAVAAGLAPWAEGSDGGGSVRIPASLCGVFGFKPTFGRIPFDLAPSAFAATAPFWHHGMLTRTVEDAALLLSILQGPHPSDPFSVPVSQGSYVPLPDPAVLPSYRIAYSPNLDWFTIDPEVTETVERALLVFEQLGCRVEMVRLGLEDGENIVSRLFARIWSVYFATYYQHYIPDWQHEMSKGLLATIRYGTKFSAADYKENEKTRHEVLAKTENVFNRFDAIVTPTLAIPAFPHGSGPTEINSKKIDPFTGWMLTSLVNLTGHPAATLNCGFSRAGLPIGLQIITRRYAENTLLHLSYAFEKAAGLERRPCLQ